MRTNFCFVAISLLLMSIGLFGCGAGERYQDQHFFQEQDRWSGGSSD
jgi:hypothetical protein